MTVIIKRELLERLDPGCELGCYPICEAKGDADCCAAKRALRTPASGAVEAAEDLRVAVEALRKIERVSYADSEEEGIARQALAALTSEPKAEGETA